MTHQSLSSCSRVRIGLLTHLKWQLFRTLEWLSDQKGNTAAVPLTIRGDAPDGEALWVFVSTIGELNAIDPLLKRLVSQYPDKRLLLITEHAHYVDTYLSRYPSAGVVVTKGHSSDAKTLARRYPPSLLVVGEIPCWPGDAPCRFSFAFLLTAKRYGAVTCIVNGWLYGYPPSCRMDALERRLFQRDYLRAFDHLAVQNEAVRDALVSAGADSSRVHVVGNLKFDAQPPVAWQPSMARSPRMLGSLIESGRPIIVGGCVTEYDDQKMVLDAFLRFRQTHPDALLVLAPRHPEVTERMTQLAGFLETRGLPSVFRSRIPDEPLSETVACLVLDTIGELRDVYAAASVAHVGVDHNVLEPLVFGKPVTVQPGWNPTYPSYPVYQLLRAEGGLIEVEEPQALANAWLALLDSPARYAAAQGKVRDVLESVKGAVDRHWRVIGGAGN